MEFRVSNTFTSGKGELPVAEHRCPGRDQLQDTIFEIRGKLRSLLLERGAFLLRGCEIRNGSDFADFVTQFSGKKLLSYAGGSSPRTALNGTRVYTSTEYPPEIRIPLHNELSYSSVYPDHVYFCCIEPSAWGGETTVGDSRRILRNVDPETIELFKDRGVQYIRNLTGECGSGYSWQDAFETSDPEVVEQICRSHGAGYEWTENGLTLSEIRPATTVHPETGEEVWFNQADGFHESNVFGEGGRSLGGFLPRLRSSFGDGSPICRLTLERIRAAIEKETVKHLWQSGDVLVLDNRLTAHGRMPFRGQRRVLVAMT